MGRLDPNVDVVKKILEAVVAARPNDAFCLSIQQQYLDRGGLSKKQLEGLLGKAQKFTDVAASKLATLEAIIKKKHVTDKSSATIKTTEEAKDEVSLAKIEAILAKYPQHKGVLLLQNELKKTGMLSATQKLDLERFCKALKISVD
jgi:hypothetical protein